MVGDIESIFLFLFGLFGGFLFFWVGGLEGALKKLTNTLQVFFPFFLYSPKKGEGPGGKPSVMEFSWQ